MLGIVKRVIQFWIICKFGTSEQFRDFIMKLPEHECPIYTDVIAKYMKKPFDEMYRVNIAELRRYNEQRSLRSGVVRN